MMKFVHHAVKQLFGAANPYPAILAAFSKPTSDRSRFSPLPFIDFVPETGGRCLVINEKVIQADSYQPTLRPAP